MTKRAGRSQGPRLGLMPLICVVAVSALAADDLHISADSLRGNLSFLASDLLEGRATPSRGLDLAAEYIASRFRGAGLEPIGDDGYFQTATVVTREQNPKNFEFTVTAGGKSIRIAPEQASIAPDKVLSLANTPIIAAAERLTQEQAAGKVVLITNRRAFGTPGAALLLVGVPGAPRALTYDPEVPLRRQPLLSVHSQELEAFLKANADARVTLHVEPAIEQRATVRNVAGVLRGSDPVLRDSCVLLTAHYDHVGTRPTGDDKIFNGANDDGSGTVSVLEIASAIARMNPRPKRSIVFMTFFGEELGMVGSRYYARHPLVPLAQTIADLNLEQLGRTDDSEGPEVRKAVVTGFDFSSMTQALVDAGKQVGVEIHNRTQSNQYFSQSDNLALAEAGVPAHTLGVAFEFPDYHGVGDEWPKIDYDNMAKIDEAVEIALLKLASDAPPPTWNESVGGAKRYVEAAKKLHPAR